MEHKNAISWLYSTNKVALNKCSARNLSYYLKISFQELCQYVQNTDDT